MSISSIRGAKPTISTRKKEPIAKVKTPEKEQLSLKKDSFSANQQVEEKTLTTKPGLTRTLAKKKASHTVKKELSIPEFAQDAVQLGSSERNVASTQVATESVNGQKKVPENTKLTELIAKTGVETNQDLINHFYQEGGDSWDGAQRLAKENGVDLNDLVRDRGGAIQTEERPILGGELGQLAAANGLGTNQDLINHFYKEGRGTWEGAQEVAQKYGSDLNTLVKDRQATIRTSEIATPRTDTATPRTDTATPRTDTATPRTDTATPRTDTTGAVREPPASENAGSIVEAARRELALGVREDAGSNEDRAGNIRKYRNAVTTLRRNRGPEAWCADFVSYVTKNAGKPLGPRGKGFASVSAMKNWFRGEGRYSTSNPQPGDVVFFKNFSHVAIVERVNRDGTVTTIEGNTSGSGGEGVHRKTRRLSTISGFGRP